MLRIQPVGYAPFSYSPYASAVDWAEAPALDPPPWQFEPQYPTAVNYCPPTYANCSWLTCGQFPLEHVSSALTIANALWQRNLLLQCGVGYEHVGMLVIYGQYSAKGASLQAVMPAVWASAEYAKLVEKKRQLLDLPT